MFLQLHWCNFEFERVYCRILIGNLCGTVSWETDWRSAVTTLEEWSASVWKSILPSTSGSSCLKCDNNGMINVLSNILTMGSCTYKKFSLHDLVSCFGQLAMTKAENVSWVYDIIMSRSKQSSTMWHCYNIGPCLQFIGLNIFTLIRQAALWGRVCGMHQIT